MDDRATVEMNFCRRCGSKLKQQAEGSHVFTYEQGHIIFANAEPSVGIALLYNDQGQVILLERAIDPGKGRLDLPGGFVTVRKHLNRLLFGKFKKKQALTVTNMRSWSLLVQA